MSLHILSKTWRDRRKGFLGWTAGIVGLVALTLAFWPSIVASGAEFERAFEQIPESMRNLFVGENPLTSPEGYLEGQLFLYTVPILFLIYAIGHGADAVAGEESRHTMDLLLANPVTRRRVLLEKFGATSLGLLLLGAILLVSLVVGSRIVDMEIGLKELAAVCTGVVLLALQFGAFALLISAWTGKKGISVAIPSAVAVTDFFVNSLAPQVDALETVRYGSSFYYYIGSAPLNNGFPPGHFAFLLGTALLFAIAGVALFDRRDVAV